MNESDIRVLEAINPQGVGLRIEFARQGKRWLHRVSVVQGLGSLPILESVEGDDSQPFPPSPPLQHLVFERRADDVPVAMSVGMAGKSHWSVCVEAFPDTASVRLDVACRCPGGNGGQLGSTYLPLVPWHWSDNTASDGAIFLSAQVGSGRYCLLPQPVSGVGVAAISLLADSITIRPRNNDAADAAVRTQRWCYEFRPVEDAASG